MKTSTSETGLRFEFEFFKKWIIYLQSVHTTQINECLLYDIAICNNKHESCINLTGSTEGCL